MTYDNPWLFNNSSFTEDMIGDYYGFVYMITNLIDDRKYIGRKYFWNFRKAKGKKRKQKTQSDWMNYYGSCEELIQDIEKLGKENFKREILHLHRKKGAVNYYEVKEQFLKEVLERDDFYNDNINGKWFDSRCRKYLIEMIKNSQDQESSI